ncbi:MAG: alternative ribosome rescue aminoacyl-tRNA hydrolase ArfB [Aromatoleum sp.]|jgi:ribosome-associated protein|uniref:alternative ribosome rescue aminoacyl-tRNA hydrolase ArfB n=1 Tax=Aromatoleum sp. TaxID=2307007 RepID=UPI0028947C2E|nr:alternative ribosome rescue aminoacyl-tRNA hydrolase ArfB [Aromatoleum sp.]MDT3670085.1 alternative ribosome rescue aminoacyl-tRNA hydrolase ArfB [Aromatoleum sp.]
MPGETELPALPEEELEERFIRSSGPGGQNVNKVSTAVELRFDAAHSPSLTDAVRQRLISLAGRRATSDGVIVITAQRFRTQERNRADARTRLAELIARASELPTPRIATTPTKASMKRRLESKRAQGERKRQRAGRDSLDPSD